MRPQRTPGGSLLLSLLPFLLSFLPLHAADLDRDGLDDAFEESVARAFLPMIWYRDTESCAEPGVILFHVRPYVPGGSPDTLAVTYSVAYYEDCGDLGHDFDLETFALTLYPLESGSLGYGVHGIRAWAHRGSLLCESEEDRTYDPPRPNVPAVEDTLYASWEDIYASGGKHGFYLNESTCDSACFGTDWCDADLLMNAGRLVPGWQGQFFDMVNIGEINDPMIEDFSEIDAAGGYTFGPRGLWSEAWMVGAFYSTAPGPGLPVSVSILSTYDDPLAVCEEQSVSFSLPWRALVYAAVYTLPGDLLSGRYLGEFCAAETTMALSWDGLDSHGDCVPPGNNYLVLEAHRANDGASDSERFGVGFLQDDHPANPTGLEAAVDEAGISLAWTDHAAIEDGFVVERREDACAFARIGLAPAHPGTGTVTFRDDAVDPGTTYTYRVFAYRTFSGYSAFSNEAMAYVPRCDAAPHTILDGPVLQADTVFAGRSYAVDVTTADPDCPFVHYDWTVAGNEWTEPGTILGSGDEAIYVAPEAPALTRDYPMLQNRIDVVTSYAGAADTASTGWFTIVIAPPPDTPGCPMLYVPVDRQWRAENNLLPLSEVSDDDRIDPCPLRMRPDRVDGAYVLEIREDGRGHSFLDAVELRIVDHAPSVRIGVTSGATIFGYADEAAPTGTGVSPIHFDTPGSRYLVANTRPLPKVKSFGPSFQGDDPGSITVPGALGAGFCLPRHLGGRQFIDLGPDGDPAPGRDVRGTGFDGKRLESIGMAVGVTDAFQVTAIVPKQAVHSVRGGIADFLADRDGRRAELLPGESIRLVFPAPLPPSGSARDFILFVTGHYKH